MSTFDVNAFQNSQYAEASSTEYVPVPEGEYPAVIDKYAIREAKGNVILDLTWKIDDADVAAETGLDNPQVRQSIFLDVDENSGTLAFGKGKNVQLGRLREALNQNTSGQPWSFGMLLGQVAKIRTKHRIDSSSGTDITRVDVNAVVGL